MSSSDDKHDVLQQCPFCGGAAAKQQPTDAEIMAAYRREYFATQGGELKHRDSDEAVLAAFRRLIPPADSAESNWQEVMAEVCKIRRQIESAQSAEVTSKDALWNLVRLAAEGSDWNRENETMQEWAFRMLQRSNRSASGDALEAARIYREAFIHICMHMQVDGDYALMPRSEWDNHAAIDDAKRLDQREVVQPPDSRSDR